MKQSNLMLDVVGVAPHTCPFSHFQFSLNVWVGIAGDFLIGPHFFPGTLTAKSYHDFLGNILPQFHF